MKKILTFAVLLCVVVSILAVSVGAACDHNWVIDLESCVAPTCTKDGKNVYKCSRCSYTKTEIVEKLGHDYVKQSGNYASCTEDSTVIEKCSVCGDEQADTTKAKGHSYTEIKRVAATCSKEGTITYKCDVCKVTKTEPIATTDHDFSKFISSSATCTTKGQSTYQCSMCSELTLKSVTKLGHDLVTEGGPTCTESGRYTYSCTRCDYTKTSTIQSALGHDVPKDRDDWTVTRKATCETEGTIRAKCDRCKKYVTETVEKTDHNYATERYVIKLPTSSTTGKYVRICERCDDRIEKTIAKGTTDLSDYYIAPVTASVSSSDVPRGTEIKLSCELADVKIYYTIDGKSPISSSNRKTYSEPITITDTTIVKAIAKYNGSMDVDIDISEVATFTYIIDDDAPWVYLEDDASLGGYMSLPSNKKFRPDAKATRYEVIEAMDNLFGSWAEDEKIIFTDVDKEYQGVVSKFVGAKLLNGYEDLTFRGNANIKRGELCKVLAIALGLKIDWKADVTFSDVTINHWAFPYITALAEEGYIAGDTDGTFRPEDNITRAELCVVLNRIAEIELTEGVDIADVDDDHWAYNYICSAVQESK